MGGEEGRWGGGGGDGRAPTTGRSGPENVRSPSRAPCADERRRIWCGWATGPPQPDVVGASSPSSQQPAAAASSTGLRDTREGGERGARGRSRPGGSRRADRAPREGRTPSPQPRRGRGGAGCCQGARCCCCQGHAHVTLGWRRALVRLRRARGGRAARSRARRARPHSPGGVADLGGCRGSAGSGGSGGQMHDRRSVESKDWRRFGEVLCGVCSGYLEVGQKVEI